MACHSSFERGTDALAVVVLTAEVPNYKNEICGSQEDPMQEQEIKNIRAREERAKKGEDKA